jgi:hypothetical protein
VKCINPGAIAPEAYIAYLDNEASPDLARHIAACPACAAIAAEYAATQRRLRQRLWRVTCPAPQELGEYELQLLAPAARTRIAAHIVACPRCEEEVRQLRNFMASENAEHIRPVERLRRIVATLLAPPAPAAYAGLRGARAGGPLTYQAAGLTVTLDLEPAPRDGGVNVTGLLWQDDAGAETLTGQTAALVAADDTVRSTPVDEFGNFSFDAVAIGAYRLEVVVGDRLVTIEGLRIQR